MADNGQVTLKIDAETAAYLQKMVEVGASTKKAMVDQVKEAHGPMKQMTEFLMDAGKELFKWSLPLSAASAAMTLLEKSTEAWHERLKQGSEVLDKVASLTQSIYGAGRGSQSAEITEQLERNAPGLDEVQRKAVFSSYVQGNAVATPEDIGRAAAGAQKASLLGRDISQFSRLQGSLDRGGVKNADDVANYLMQYAPDGADKASEAIAKAPGQAKDIAELFATAERGGKGPRSLLMRAESQWAMRGGSGSIREYLNTRTAGPEGRADLEFLTSARNQAPALEAGSLGAESEAALSDPNLAVQYEVDQSRISAEGRNGRELGSAIRHKRLALAAENLQDMRHSWIGNALRDADLMSFEGEQSYSRIKRDMSDEEIVKYMKDLRDSNAKMAEPQPLRPRLGQQGEQAP